METFDDRKREKEEIREEMEASTNWKDVNMSAAFPVSWSTHMPSPHHPPACKRRRPINKALLLAQ